MNFKNKNPEKNHIEPQITELKKEIDLLREELEYRKRKMEDMCQDKAHLIALIEHAPDIIMRFDENCRHLFVNRAIEKVVPMAAADYIGKSHRELGFPEKTCSFWEYNLKKIFLTGELQERETPYAGIHGTRIFNWRLIPEYEHSGKISSILCMARDVTEQRLAEQSYARLFDTMPYGFALHEMVYDEKGKALDYRFLSVNPAFENLTGLKADDILGRRVLDVLPDTEKEWIDRYAKVAAGAPPIYFESFSKALNKYFEVTAYGSGKKRFATLFHDVTERKNTEKEREKLKSLLAQSDKLNAVGRLAGGVAHDFNNKLSVITGYTEFALDRTDPSDEIYADLEEIIKATRSATELTRQLLTFARREKANPPKIIDVNDVITSMLNMLRRLIGENIELLWQPEKDIWALHMDPSQLDQILINLCVNARDAIGKKNGRITIETSNTNLQYPSEAAESDIFPGDYVSINITDNGCGMGKETMEQIFEPFFTTKKDGEGTGLGLATVYGIVRQNQGIIRVYSEVDMGTAFGIFLPSYKNHEPEPELIPTAQTEERGMETLLLVEDDPGLLALNQTMLERLGYQVLPAALPEEALNIADSFEGEIAMMLTDVVMPGMNGPELSKILTERFPKIKSLFMSGYSQNMILQQGFANGNIGHFIQKPFSFKDLSLKVRQILDTERSLDE
ncbi:hybrid sensor histidine kinase/response regulator [Desulfobotulus mexicanus]|uniref:histidine kinase n=1 Tax=Desulfobotulus mexicanus TaxID=2586642 RepID=A0A5S5MDP7_9BACT|nr:PAS domain-containing sensor histidine kinase [Desulfobotulus mexicanus]TYT73827.1 PAS domain S-box protein [Desulfobotulus mexicanus]